MKILPAAYKKTKFIPYPICEWRNKCVDLGYSRKGGATGMK